MGVFSGLSKRLLQNGGVAIVALALLLQPLYVLAFVQPAHASPDKTAPVFAITHPTDGSYVRGVQTIDATVMDESDIFKLLMNVAGSSRSWTNGVSSTIVRSGDIFSTTFDTTTVSDGPVWVVLRGTDGAGNVRYWNNNAAHRQHVFYIDNTAPKITIKEGFVGDTTAKVFSNVSFKLYDANKVDKYDINGHGVDLTNNTWSDANFNNIKQYLIAGENTITLYDVAGNSSSYTFLYDTTAPTAPTVTKPGARQWLNGASTVNSWTAATDENGIAEYEVKYEFVGAPTAYRTVSGSELSRTQKFSGNYQGPITISVRAKDIAGNWGAYGAQVTYNYDSLAPTTDIAVSPVVNGAFTVSGNADDNLALNRVYVQLVSRVTGMRCGGTTVNLIPYGAHFNWSVDYDIATLGENCPAGDFAAHVEVSDMAGNRGTAGWTQKFTVSAPEQPVEEDQTTEPEDDNDETGRGFNSGVGNSSQNGNGNGNQNQNAGRNGQVQSAQRNNNGRSNNSQRRSATGANAANANGQPANTAVLGDATATPNSGVVQGASTDTAHTSTAAVTIENTKNGFAWYWWSLIVFATLVAAWWLIAAIRRRQQEN